MEGLGERVATLEANVKVLAEAIIKLTRFEEDGRAFFSEQRAVQEYKGQERREFRAWLIVLFTLLLVIIGFLTFFAARPATKSQIISHGPDDSALSSTQDAGDSSIK